MRYMIVFKAADGSPIKVHQIVEMNASGPSRAKIMTLECMESGRQHKKMVAARVIDVSDGSIWQPKKLGVTKVISFH